MSIVVHKAILKRWFDCCMSCTVYVQVVYFHPDSKVKRNRKNNLRPCV